MRSSGARWNWGLAAKPRVKFRQFWVFTAKFFLKIMVFRQKSGKNVSKMHFFTENYSTFGGTATFFTAKWWLNSASFELFGGEFRHLASLMRRPYVYWAYFSFPNTRLTCSWTRNCQRKRFLCVHICCKIRKYTNKLEIIIHKCSLQRILCIRDDFIEFYCLHVFTNNAVFILTRHSDQPNYWYFTFKRRLGHSPEMFLNSEVLIPR